MPAVPLGRACGKRSHMQRGRPMRKSKSGGGLVLQAASPLRGNAEQVRLVSASLVKQRRRRESVRQGAESRAPRYRPVCLNYASQRHAFGCSGVPHIRSTDWPFATSHASPHARANRARPRVVPRPTKRPSCAARCSGRHCTGPELDHHPDSWSDAHYADLPAHSRLADLCS